MTELLARTENGTAIRNCCDRVDHDLERDQDERAHSSLLLENRICVRWLGQLSESISRAWSQRSEFRVQTQKMREVYFPKLSVVNCAEVVLCISSTAPVEMQSRRTDRQ
jgi:hypothetical protein